MEKVAKLLDKMVEAGIIAEYAVFGAVAQMRYTDAVATFDADVLVALSETSGLDILGPIYAFCRDCGYSPEGDAVRVGDWPVQFIPAFSALTEEAIKTADVGDLDGVPLRVVRADYLAVIALSVGRAKELARVVALRESGAVDDAGVAQLAVKHDLAESWAKFKERFCEG